MSDESDQGQSGEFSWRNGHDMWVECDKCGKGTEITGEIDAERREQEDSDWQLMFVAKDYSRIQLAKARCPDHAD